MAKISKIYTLITADDKPFRRGLAKAHDAAVKGTKKIQTALNKINFKAVALGMTAVAGTTAFAMKKFIDLAVEQERVEKRLEAVLKATGNAAGFNAAQLKAVASALQELTTMGDETILSSMAMLATFKQIRGEAFVRTTEAALDLAEVMEGGLREATIQLGKALNDPIANLGALGRAGVQFTKDQKELIKSLWETGQITQAQSVILKELESQFGGTARAARETFGGALKSVRNTLSDIGETIGFSIMKHLNPMLKNFQEWLKVNEDLIDQNIPVYIDSIANSLKAVSSILGKIVELSKRESIGKIFLEGAKYAEMGMLNWEKFKEATFKQRQEMVEAVREMMSIPDDPWLQKYKELPKKIKPKITPEIDPQIRIDTIIKAAKAAEETTKKAGEWVAHVDPFYDKLIMKEKRYFDDVSKNIITMQQSYETATYSMSSAFSDFVQTGKLDFKSLVASILADLARLQISKLFTTIGAGLFGGAAGGGATTEMQHGGFIGERVRGLGLKSGKSYEFHPNEFVIPHDKIGGSNVEIVINNNSGQPATATETVGPDNTKRIMVWIGQDIMNRGPIHRAITNSFVVQPRGRTT